MVAAECGSPGVLRRIAPIAPPKPPPFITPTSIPIADRGAMVKVSGMATAMAMGAFSPGMAPITMPMTTPATTETKVESDKASRNAATMTSISFAPLL